MKGTAEKILLTTETISQSISLHSFTHLVKSIKASPLIGKMEQCPFSEFHFLKKRHECRGQVKGFSIPAESSANTL